MHLASPAPALQPTRPILRDATTREWVAKTKVGGDELGSVAARALQFSLEGDGVPSTRRLVPQTEAAAKLLSGPQGAAVEQALRGIVATTDAHEGTTSIAGISLARGERDFAVNSALTWLERGDVKGWNPRGGAAAKEALGEALDGGRQIAKMAVAQAPGWVNLGPFATRQLLRLAGSDSTTTADATMGAWIATLAAHEPHHTITPPRTGDIIKSKFLQEPLPKELEKIQKEDPFSTLKPLNWIEEGTADVLSSWAGVLPATAAKMGVPSLATLPEPAMPEDFDVIMALQSASGRGGRFTPDERVLVDAHIEKTFGTPARSDLDRMQMVVMPLTGMRNYPLHVTALHALLDLGGLDSTNPEHAPKAAELLQGARLTHVPGRIAEAIIEQQGIDPSLREELRTQVRDLGAHLNGAPDEAAVTAALTEITTLVESARPA